MLFIIVRKNLLVKLTKDNRFSIGGEEIKFSVNIMK